MDYDSIANRKRLREGKSKEELLDLFKNTYYRTERAGRLEDGCFVDLMITTHCNLNCSGCDHFAPIAEPYYVDVDTFEDQLICLKRVLPQAKIITFWGGEALLHPNIKELAVIVRKVFPNADIMIGSNGILIEKLSDETLQSLHENNIGFQISRYIKDGDIVYTGLDKLDDYDIHYSFSEYRNFFQMMTVNPLGTEDPNQWYTCSRCNMPMFTYKDYKLYKCAFGACSSAMESAKGIVIPEIEGEDYLLLSNKDLTPDDIFSFVFKPSNKCKYCKEVYVNSGFVHQLNYSKEGQYLFDMKDLFLYNYKEYKKYQHNNKSMEFMKSHFDEEMAWDTSFNSILDEQIKNRYFIGKYDIFIELSDITDAHDFLILREKIENYLSDKTDKLSYVFYIICNNLSLEIEEEAYKTFKGQYQINTVLLKRDINESLKDVYLFALENSFNKNVAFCCNDFHMNNMYLREDIKDLTFYDVSKYLPYYFDLQPTLEFDVDLPTQIEKMFFEYLSIKQDILQNSFNINKYRTFINDKQSFYSDELALAFKGLLLININNLKTDISCDLDDYRAALNKLFIKPKNLFIELYNHITFDKESLELKILSIFNRSQNQNILKIMNLYIQEERKGKYQ